MSCSDDGRHEVWSNRFARFSSFGLAVTRFGLLQAVNHQGYVSSHRRRNDRSRAKLGLRRSTASCSLCRRVIQ